jgi:hypothetical protein
LSQHVVAISAKLGKFGGSIVDVVKRNHNGGHIFTMVVLGFFLGLGTNIK